MPRSAATSASPTASAPIAALLERWRGKEVFVLFEATGSYDRLLRHALSAAGLGFARVNPARARDFARAAGILAKPVLGRPLGRPGGLTRSTPACSPPWRKRWHRPPPATAILTARPWPSRTSAATSSSTIGSRSAPGARNVRRPRCGRISRPISTGSGAASPTGHIAHWDAEISRLLHRCERLSRIARLLRSIPGIGPVAATTLIALMPELGSRPAKTMAAMAGLAPFNLDSGQLRGSRKIRGGRKRVRDALYIAALAAARSHDRFRTLYQRLRTAGKPAKLARIAVARKLLVTANAILRDNAPFHA